MSCFRTGSPGKEHGTNKPPPTRRVQERSKETLHVQPPPRILLSGIHLGWTRHAPPGRILSQNDWLKTTQKLDCEPRGRAVLLGSLTLLLSTQVPFPSKISCFVNTCVSSDNSFPSVRQESNSGPWKGSPFLQHYHHHLHLTRQENEAQKSNLPRSAISEWQSQSSGSRICTLKHRGCSVAQSCPTLCDPMDCSPPGPSVHGIS